MVSLPKKILSAVIGILLVLTLFVLFLSFTSIYKLTMTWIGVVVLLSVIGGMYYMISNDKVALHNDAKKVWRLLMEGKEELDKTCEPIQRRTEDYFTRGIQIAFFTVIFVIFVLPILLLLWSLREINFF